MPPYIQVWIRENSVSVRSVNGPWPREPIEVVPIPDEDALTYTVKMKGSVQTQDICWGSF